ncbi:PAS domain S-box protein [Paucibacter sp. TC2R-5]|uniref:sensor histidine kinase n=1 Tax=Paucibacter sp. TC2R-5 TaxID=2893555 RepID=UPI0021E3F2BE|nr:histidine kinase dimerization/phosphoacceptor domain -containing protein [Paucibacter sp. TC2R-5]MCV2360965.1 PAS domain S-box protein [Paucibacter sp. TC2R-5]
MSRPGFLPLRTLNARLTLVTLALVVLSIWTLAIYVGRIVHDDVQALLSEQQYRSVGLLAAEINDQLGTRFAALEAVAREAGGARDADPVEAQSLLDQRPVLLSLFNGGVVFIAKDGRAIADAPPLPGRVGSNYLRNTDVADCLNDGRSRVGRAVMGRILKTPVFGLIVAVRDGGGQVQGVLVGLINMAKPSFLDRITAHGFGQTGHFFLVSIKHRLSITSSDPGRVMQTLAPLGEDPALDRLLAGQHSSLVYTNPAGQEALVSLTTVPLAGWAVAASLPTEEAFAPLHAMQRRMLWAALGLSLLAAGLMWWLLQHQLAPLVQAAKHLAVAAATSSTGLPMQPLPIKRPDEIGLLIAGFNLLLAELGERELALGDSEARYRSMIERSPEPIAVHRAGRLLFANPALVKLLGGQSAQDLVGQPVLKFIHPDEHSQVLARVAQVAEGGLRLIPLESRYLKLDGSVIDVEVQGAMIEFDGAPANLALVHDITERKQSRLALQAALQEKTVLLNEVHHRVKNNLQVVSSLMRLEAGRGAEARTRQVLTDMQGRLRAMGLLHESLYRSGLFASVNLGAYLKDVAVQACRSQGSPAVRLHLDMGSLQVSLDQATPCGLLVNELITNAYKHGFVGGREGVLGLSLQPLAGSEQTDTDRQWCLRVQDDGIGLPQDFTLAGTSSLGLQLVGDLARQIGGVLTVGPLPLAAFELRFMPQNTAQTTAQTAPQNSLQTSPPTEAPKDES